MEGSVMKHSISYLLSVLLLLTSAATIAKPITYGMSLYGYGGEILDPYNLLEDEDFVITGFLTIDSMAQDTLSDVDAGFYLNPVNDLSLSFSSHHLSAVSGSVTSEIKETSTGLFNVTDIFILFEPNSAFQLVELVLHFEHQPGDANTLGGDYLPYDSCLYDFRAIGVEQSISINNGFFPRLEIVHVSENTAGLLWIILFFLAKQGRIILTTYTQGSEHTKKSINV